MGKRASHKHPPKSLTMPSSPSHSFSSSSSSDFEFTIANISPHKSSTADELFYKGQLLPLHISPRLSLVRTLLASSSTSSDSTASTSRDSSSSSASSDVVWAADFESSSSRPSSVTEDDELKRLTTTTTSAQGKKSCTTTNSSNKYFSFSRFFKKDKQLSEANNGLSSVKRVSDVFKRYIKKVKPLYEKLSHKQPQQQQQQQQRQSSFIMQSKRVSGSFSGNLGYPRRKAHHVASCPSSMRSSPTHTWKSSRGGIWNGDTTSLSSSSMEELQSAIQGAIAHCKKSMNKGSNEV